MSVHRCALGLDPRLDGIRFTWNAGKDAVNQRKHGVSLGEAKTVLADKSERAQYEPHRYA
jgi:uncharacterized DUF497 family protein